MGNKLLAILVLILFLGADAAANQKRPNSCTVCHGDRAVEYAKSIHASVQVTCTDCHGGNERDLEMTAHARRFGFKGNLKDGRPPFTKQEIVFLCSRCHSDTRLMNTYGLPSDQLQQYRVSEHGVALLKRGDRNAASCSDCHGVHTILSVKDPASTVFYKNVPETCARCHSDDRLMARYGISAEIPERYRDGVHGRMLQQENRKDVPNCSRCHGSHGAAPPGVVRVENVCGQCHAKTRQFFDASPHRPAFQARGISQCVSCHDPHYTERADLSYFESRCTSCHEEGSGEYRRAQQIRVLVQETEQELAEVEEILKSARKVGIYVDPYVEQLSEARTRLIEAIPASHSLALEDIERYTSEARGIAADIQIELNTHLGERNLWRYLMLGIWGFILIVVVSLYLQMRRREKELEQEEPVE